MGLGLGLFKHVGVLQMGDAVQRVRRIELRCVAAWPPRFRNGKTEQSEGR